MHLIHSSQIPAPYIAWLESALPDLKLLPMPRMGSVYSSISSHPDIFIFPVDGKTLIHSPEIPESFIKNLDKAHFGLIRSQASPFGKYPDTAPLNAARVGRFIFHNLKLTDAGIKKNAEKFSLHMLHVDQGYTRCSVLAVGANALITSDKGIAKESERAGLDTLLIRAGNILLPGENYGFIGGSSGTMPDSSIIFLGDVSSHPDFRGIATFLKKHSVAFKYLPHLPLFDGGSLFFFN